MPKQQLKWIVTANFTADGAVAYLKADRSFSGNLSEAEVFPGKDEAEAARQVSLRAEAIVTDPYLTEVADTGATLDVLTARERIRSQGPTVPYGRLIQKPSAV
ncbi:MAG: hypothetical protein RL701_3473 [Pseudomonadota bacterium]